MIEEQKRGQLPFKEKPKIRGRRITNVAQFVQVMSCCMPQESPWHETERTFNLVPPVSKQEAKTK